MTQQDAGKRLGVSQAYLALIEGGRRSLTDALGFQMVNLYHLPPTDLPLETSGLNAWESASIAKAIANLGYSGFRQLRRGKPKNPAVVLLGAISCPDLEVRVVESLPWLALEYPDLDWEWLAREAKVRDVQNRLGFVVTLGRSVSERRRAEVVHRKLRQVEDVLECSRLVREDTLCQDSLSGAERRWLRRERPAEARHWNLLTDLDAERLPYAA